VVVRVTGLFVFAVQWIDHNLKTIQTSYYCL